MLQSSFETESLQRLDFSYVDDKLINLYSCKILKYITELNYEK